MTPFSSGLLWWCGLRKLSHFSWWTPPFSLLCPLWNDWCFSRSARPPYRDARKASSRLWCLELDLRTCGQPGGPASLLYSFHPLPHLHHSFPLCWLWFLSLTLSTMHSPSPLFCGFYVSPILCKTTHTGWSRYLSLYRGRGGESHCSEFHLTSGNHLLPLPLFFFCPFSVALCCNVNRPVIILLPSACCAGWWCCLCEKSYTLHQQAEIPSSLSLSGPSWALQDDKNKTVFSNSICIYCLWALKQQEAPEQFIQTI